MPRRPLSASLAVVLCVGLTVNMDSNSFTRSLKLTELQYLLISSSTSFCVIFVIYKKKYIEKFKQRVKKNIFFMLDTTGLHVSIIIIISLLCLIKEANQNLKNGSAHHYTIIKLLICWCLCIKNYPDYIWSLAIPCFLRINFDFIRGDCR